MPVKLIAMDLDGTLMSGDHITVTEKTKKALKKAHNMGVKTAIATGRTMNVTENVTAQLPFIDYVIYSNGAAVFDRCKGESLYTMPFFPETAAAVTDILEEYPVYYEIYANGGIHSQQSKADYFVNADLPQEFLDEYIKSVEFHESICDYAKKSAVEKINLFYFGGEYYEEIRKRLLGIGGIAFTSPISGDLEMTRKGVNKGLALREMCAVLGYSPDEVMAFGDADNDIEMLEFAKYGIAMANASQVCKNAAKYVTLSNDEDGIAAALEKFVFLPARPKLLVSACLLGENCKYNGENNYNESVVALGEKFELIPVCPECFGGLPTPREPNEIKDGRVVSKSGNDNTSVYADGAEKCLYIANESNCRAAVLKSRSPSCGFGEIYDGTFSKQIVKGNGFTAQLLYDNGIKIFNETQARELAEEFTDWEV